MGQAEREGHIDVRHSGWPSSIEFNPASVTS
jgi:hypothetical protein